MGTTRNLREITKKSFPFDLERLQQDALSSVRCLRWPDVQVLVLSLHSKLGAAESHD
jgi:hypothetical protein